MGTYDGHWEIYDKLREEEAWQRQRDDDVRRYGEDGARARASERMNAEMEERRAKDREYEKDEQRRKESEVLGKDYYYVATPSGGEAKSSRTGEPLRAATKDAAEVLLSQVLAGFTADDLRARGWRVRLHDVAQLRRELAEAKAQLDPLEAKCRLWNGDLRPYYAVCEPGGKEARGTICEFNIVLRDELLHFDKQADAEAALAHQAPEGVSADDLRARGWSIRLVNPAELTQAADAARARVDALFAQLPWNEPYR